MQMAAPRLIARLRPLLHPLIILWCNFTNTHLSVSSNGRSPQSSATGIFTFDAKFANGVFLWNFCNTDLQWFYIGAFGFSFCGSTGFGATKRLIEQTQHWRLCFRQGKPIINRDLSFWWRFVFIWLLCWNMGWVIKIHLLGGDVSMIGGPFLEKVCNRNECNESNSMKVLLIKAF